MFDIIVDINFGLRTIDLLLFKINTEIEYVTCLNKTLNNW